jgi:hypothetical protein
METAMAYVNKSDESNGEEKCNVQYSHTVWGTHEMCQVD